MPAFELAEFEKQVSILQRAFSRPTDFLKLLREMFERYGMPAFRVGSGVAGVPEPAYHVSDLMIRQIERLDDIILGDVTGLTRAQLDVALRLPAAVARREIARQMQAK